jgi:predicted outer membrane repeat protein
VQTDMTDALTVGTYTTLSTDGTLTVCPGEWYARLTTTADVVIEGLDETTTTLSGGGNDTVITVADGSLSVARVRIDRGSARGAGNASKGGGVQCDGARKVTLTDTVLTNNTAYDGGAIYAGDGCRVEATRVVFSDNSAEDDGGTLCSFDGGAVVLSNVTIEGGSARDGGAIYLFRSTSLDIEDSVFQGNTASMIGGAIVNYESSMTIGQTTFIGNRADDGGAILNIGDAALDRVSFTDNAAEVGGAVFAYSSATTSGTQCSFSGNGPDDVAVGATSFTFDETIDFLCDGQGCTWDPVSL